MLYKALFRKKKKKVDKHIINNILLFCHVALKYS